MMKTILAISAVAMSALLSTNAAKSDLYIGLQIDNDTITQVASDPHNAVWSGLFGPFAVDNVSGTDLVNLIDSQSLQVTTKGSPGHEFKVYVTATDQDGTGPVQSSFTSQTLETGWTETLSSWFDPGNGIFALTQQLGSETFSAIGTSIQYATAGLGSITTLYKLTAPARGAANATIQVAAIPEPSTLGLLGAALFGMGVLRRRMVS